MSEGEGKITERSLRKLVKLESYISVMAEGAEKERLAKAFLELVEAMGLPDEYGESLRKGRV